MINKLARTNKQKSQAGFTIIEIMIASLVFSTVLVLITIGIISFTNAYYKGINESATQTTARSIVENIAQAIQFNGGEVTTDIKGSGGWTGICVGDQAYGYLLGKQLVDGSAGAGQTNHALILNTGLSNCAGQKPPPASYKGTELLSPHMRLAKLDLSQNSGDSNLWTVDVKVVYGDDDLLNKPTSPDATCKGSIGQQFCAVSELSTTVEKRINLDE